VFLTSQNVVIITASLKNKTNHFFKNSLLSPNVLNDLLNGVIFLALSLAEVCFVVVRGLMIVVV